MSDTSSDEDEAVINSIVLAASNYASTYYFKEPCRTSALSGAKWVAELEEGNPTRIFENFRMTRPVFESSCEELAPALTSTCWSRVDPRESAAIFLYCISHNATNRELQERFQRSDETVSRHFHEVLDAVCSMGKKYIVLPTTPSPQMAANPKCASQFDNCRLAFDGTHIPAFVSDASKAKPFRNRKSTLTQNVFAACTIANWPVANVPSCSSTSSL